MRILIVSRGKARPTDNSHTHLSPFEYCFFLLLHIHIAQHSRYVRGYMLRLRLRGRSLLCSVKVLNVSSRSCAHSHQLKPNMEESMCTSSSAACGDSLDDAMFPQLVSQILAPQTKLPEKSIYTISQLLFRDQCTVPFLVRYRQREMASTDPPTDVSAPVLFKLQQELEKWASLVKLRKSRLAALVKSGQQVDEMVVARLEQCLTRAELDEAYEGVKPAARTTKVEAAKAVEGLEEVASLLLNERRSDSGQGNSKVDTNGLSDLLKKHQLRRDDPTFRTHLQNYLADHVAHSVLSVASAKQLMLSRVRVTASEAKATTAKSPSSTFSSKTKAGEGKSKLKSNISIKNTQDHQKYRDYFHFDRALRGVPSHQVLALRRGKEAGALKVSLTVEERALAALQSQLRYQYQVISKADFHPLSLLQWRNSLMVEVVMDAVQRLMAPAITRLAWKNALEVADEEALGLFASNLRHLLLTPPLMQYLDQEAWAATSRTESSSTASPLSSAAAKIESALHTLIVCGIDPGFAHGHKIVVLAFPLLVASAKPKVLCCTKLYASSRECGDQMAELLVRHKVQVVAIGNGTGSREAQDMTKQALSTLLLSSSSSPSSSSTLAFALACRVALVSEVGASVYSVSPLADAEYPDMDVAFRGAISIAGRLVDPLREMVKVPPASLGLGMYQHDLKEAVLSRRLGEVLQEIVSDYGVDLNMASEEMLCYVSGLQRNRAKAIILHREQHGGFRNREEVRAVKGIGETTFRNCAGFLRVYPPRIPLSDTRQGKKDAAWNSERLEQELYDPLDTTNVHPEKYPAARVLLRAAWSQQQRQKELGGFNNNSIRQLLFSADLQTYLQCLSEEEWVTLAAKCSKALAGSGSTKEVPVLAVSEVKQLSLWLSAEEFCGDNYAVDSALSFTGASADTDGGAGRRRLRGIRSTRGQPPLLTSVAAGSGAGSRAGCGDVVSSDLRKKKRDFDDITAGVGKKNSSVVKPKRFKTTGAGAGGDQLTELKVGQERIGTVRNVTAFGVFLDIGASRDALLHISEFSSNKKKKKEGQGSKCGGQSDGESCPPLVLGATVRVRVIDIDTARGRISLTQTG